MVAQEALIQRLMAGEQLQSEVVQITLGADAPNKWMSLSSTSNFESDGQLKDIKLTLVDVTELKETQLQLEESQRILEQTNAMARIGGWEIDIATGEGVWTSEAAAIYGFPPEQALNLELGLSHYHPEDRPKIEEALRQAIEEGKAWDGEFRLIDAKGKVKWTHSKGSPVISRGKTIRIKGVLQDVSEKKMLESLITDISEESAEYYSKFKNALFDTIKAVSLTVEQRDPYTAGHMKAGLRDIVSCLYFMICPSAAMDAKPASCFATKSSHGPALPRLTGMAARPIAGSCRQARFRRLTMMGSSSPSPTPLPNI
ncbi:MAG: PAS domain S-box protein [Alphaproteobacteria bacterium]|nr:PAS domain S-box protein [Alphaproteobacteria bacterium]